MSSAETARTLAMGRLEGVLKVPGRSDGLPVVHATDAAGRVLIAAARDSEENHALRSAGQAPVALVIDDQPPVPHAPHLGRVRIGGSPALLTGEQAREGAIAFAENNPAGTLLDIGCGVDLYRIDTAEVTLTNHMGAAAVDVESFTTSQPDPFHADERDLLLDLQDHHRLELAPLTGLADAAVLPVRLDRYGLTLLAHTHASRRYIRLEFPQAAHGPCCVARVLRLGMGIGH